MSTPTDDERCPKCHIAYEVASPPLTRAYLQRVTTERDDLAREVERLNVRFQHEQHAKRSAIMAHRDAKAEAERLRGERDEAQHEALRWAARDHIGQRFPGEAVVKREAARAARFRGWDHLKFEADACPGCRGVGGSEECGDCEVCKGRGKVGGQP